MFSLGVINEFLGQPPNASEHGYQIDHIIEFSHWFMAALFVGWSAFFVYVLLRFRKSRHPVAVFLNLDAVKLALRTGEQEKKASMQQIPREIIAGLIREGAIVLICQPCLVEFGLKLDHIVPGVQVSRPGYLENFVFADNVRTLTW